MVGDALLSSEGREEALSKAYALVVAAAAGYTTAVYDFDRSGIDLLVQGGGHLSPLLALQLKATINLRPLRAMDGSLFSFPLKGENYESLRRPTQIPRLLVVLDLPAQEAEWTTITTEELVLRRCAYWLNLNGCPESTRVRPTVYIPKSQVFDVPGLHRLMEQSRSGSL